MKKLCSLTTLILIATTTAALAHHPLGGEVPDSVWHGFLSGVGHPVIGFDHFVFVVAIGLLAAMQHVRYSMPIGFIAGTIAGTLLSVSLVTLPFAEWVITMSVVLAGALAMRGRETITMPATLLAGVAGIFHGWAYGEAVIGAEVTPLIAYLTGFSLVQLAIALGTGYVVRVIWKASSADALPPRLTGALVAGVGVSYLVELIESVVFPAM